MMNATMICPECGKELSGTEMHFCPYCGVVLGKPAAAVQGTVDEVRARYQEYIEWVQSARSQKELGRVLTTFLTGNRAFKNSPEHERFMLDVQGLTEALSVRYQAGEMRETLPELMQFVLLDCHEDVSQEVDWMFLALEKVFMPLLSLLTQEEAEALYLPYKLLRKRQPGLEIQKSIRKELKRMAKL